MLSNIKEDLKTRLSEKRRLHTLGVAETAVHLGKIFHEDIIKLETAALLHDYAKGMNHEEQLKYAQENGIFLDTDDLKAKGTIHAIIGAQIARAKYCITDMEILKAIHYHTCGHPDMTRFQKIIFASDFLDPTRGFAESKDILKRLEDDFERGILEILKMKIEYVFKKDEHLHPNALLFYNKQIEVIHQAL